MEPADPITVSLDDLTQDQLQKLDQLLDMGLGYYADPGNYFALDIRKKQGVGLDRGDFWKDFGDEISGPYAETIKPGEFARAAFNRLFELQGQEPIDWQEMEIQLPWHAYKTIIGIDMDEREETIRAKHDAEWEQYKAEQKAKQAKIEGFEEFKCCGMNTENAVVMPVQMIPHPDGAIDYKTKEITMVVQETCPKCNAPTSRGRSHNTMNQSYMCGTHACKEGHVGNYRDGTTLCDHFAKLGKAHD